jgi:hypothetical protein
MSTYKLLTRTGESWTEHASGFTVEGCLGVLLSNPREFDEIRIVRVGAAENGISRLMRETAQVAPAQNGANYFSLYRK